MISVVFVIDGVVLAMTSVLAESYHTTLPAISLVNQLTVAEVLATFVAVKLDIIGAIVSGVVVLVSSSSSPSVFPWHAPNESP